ncbi:MAG: UdgX family uracil-DNA binding protein [Burkholderiales bacterium]
MVRLAGPTDWAGFVHAARSLLYDKLPPESVRWIDGEAPELELFDAARPVDALQLPAVPPLALPASFVDRAKSAALHADPARFDLLYRLVCRLNQDRRLAQDPFDTDWRRLEALASAVRREMHKTKAFVRFRKVALDRQPDTRDASSASTTEPSTSEANVRHVAWFEPEHHVMEAIAPFFVRRFGQMNWAILTPRVSVSWDRHTLHLGPGADPCDAPAPDADEALWLAYYASIFNPARVKEAMMKKEMPVRYWKNLPEARLIAPLMADAPARVREMVDAEAGDRTRRRGLAAAGVGPADLSPQVGDAALAAASRRTDRAVAMPSPATLDQLAARAARCRDCPIGDGATQMVWGEGAPEARLMLVGEQPGDREDLQGRPFVGPAGKLLRRAFEQLGWPAERVYITNAVKHFKYELRGKRRIHKTANQKEVDICSGWLEAEIAAIEPQAMVALGATAARSLLGRAVQIGKNEGEWIQRDQDGRPVLILMHPSALLRMDGGDLEAAFERWAGLLDRASGYVDEAHGGAAAD